jgi:uncharacterized membrane protein YeaQ/YmgE (transglycosylase-associated protein family)
MLSLLWTILIGFIAGVIAKFVTPGDTHEPQGFILTTALGIARTGRRLVSGWSRSRLHRQHRGCSAYSAGMGIYREPPRLVQFTPQELSMF